MENQTCEERIDEQFENTMEEIDDALRSSDKMDEFMEDILEFTPSVTVKVLLSTGGPADWIELEVSKGKHGYEIDGAVYHFSDWYDHAERRITGSELDKVTSMFEAYVETLNI